MTSTAEVSKGQSATLPEIGDKCRTDPDCLQDLPNGPSSDLIHANDLEKSYVFVTGEDGLPDDPVGDVEAISLSLSKKVDPIIGKLDEGRTGGSVQLGNGYSPVRTDKSFSEPESKPVEDSLVVKSPVEDTLDPQFVAPLDKNDDLVKFQSTPDPVENKESEVGLGASELVSESVKNRVLHTSISGSANDGCEEQNGNGKCINQVDISSTEELEASQGSQVGHVDIVDCDCESRYASLVAVDQVKLSQQMVEGTQVEIPSSGSPKLDMHLRTINNQEVQDDDSKTSLSLDIHKHQHLDTALESNCEFVSEHRDETETVASSINCHVESVCDVENVSFAGNGIQHAEDSVKHPGGSEMSQETMDAESQTEASLLTETAPPSSAHPPETEWEVSDADNKNEVSLLLDKIRTSSIHPPEIEGKTSGADNKTEASFLIETIQPSSAPPPQTERETFYAESKTEASLLTETIAPSSAHPLETERESSDAESKIEASLLAQTVTPSSSHTSETGREFADAAGVETIASLLVGTTSHIMENKLSAHESGIGSTTNKDLTQEPEGPTLQDGETTVEAEVSIGLSKAADSQTARNDEKMDTGIHDHDNSKIRKGEKMDAVLGTCTTEVLDSNERLDPGVHFIDNSRISNDEKMVAVTDTCTTEVLDVFNAENGTVYNTLFETETIQYLGGQLDAADDSHENELQENVDPRESATFIATSESDVHIPDISDNEGTTDVGGVTGTAIRVKDIQNLVDQSDCAAGSNHENMGLQQNEVPGKFVVEVNSEPEVDVLSVSATSSGENTGAVPGACEIEVLDRIDALNEGVAIADLEVKDTQYKEDQLDGAKGGSHEEAVLQENVVNENRETTYMKLEHDVYFHSFSAIRSGEKNDEKFPACRTEVLGNYNVNQESEEKNEEEDIENTADKKLDGAADRDLENLIFQENETTGESGIDEITEAEPEGSVSNTIGKKKESVKMIVKPFNFLVRVPRFDDDSLREQIRLAKQDVEEKTKIRDAIQALVHERRTSNQIHGVDYEFSRANGRSARNSVRSKRVEIDSLQSMINKAKNALSIEDIDNRIQNMEHMIQHETLPLREEKQIIREIKQMKQLREQLSSNLGDQDEIKHALEQRKDAEERLKTIRKELDVLKDEVLKAEAACMETGKKYDDENKKIRELQAQFRAADDVRQLAYAQLQSLRKRISKKNEHFFKYKDATAIANNYVYSGNKEALYGLCTENVEHFVKLWNTDIEFRKDYVRCNARSTVRRLGTLDGRALGPGEQPPVLPSYAESRSGNKISAPVKVDVASPIPIPELKDEITVKTVPSEDKSGQKVKEPKSQKIKETAAPAIQTGYDYVADLLVPDVVHEEPKKSEEEMKSEEAEANKLKEQRRLEALAKAYEARERKKRQAEKLLMRAELKLQKDAEQKEKEREKRLRKKERKKAGTTAEINDTNHHSENAPSSESASEINKDIEVKEMASATAKKSQKRWVFTKQSKSKTIPPPLRSRNKRKLLQQWMWVGFACFLVIFLFWVANVSLFSNGIPKRRSPLY